MEAAVDFFRRSLTSVLIVKLVSFQDIFDDESVFTMPYIYIYIYIYDICLQTEYKIAIGLYLH